jgi:hypothetical protein
MGHKDVIGQHIVKLNQVGQVVFAKIGKPLGRGRVEEINNFSSKGTSSTGFLVARVSGAYRVHEILIEHVWSKWRPEFNNFVPEYYNVEALRPITKCWIMISSMAERPPFKVGEFSTLSGNDLAHALSYSMGSIFLAAPTTHGQIRTD